MQIITEDRKRVGESYAENSAELAQGESRVPRCLERLRSEDTRWMTPPISLMPEFP